MKCLWTVHHLWFKRNTDATSHVIRQENALDFFQLRCFPGLQEKLTEINWKAINVDKHFVKGHKHESR